MEPYWILILPLAAIALLYASVGHGGASGYLAIMALAGLAPEMMKPTALILNLLVSTLAMVAFFRAGHFQSRLFWPFALFSVPFAFFGGHVQMDPRLFQGLIAVVLAFSAIRLCLPMNEAPLKNSPRLGVFALAGSIMGFVSGLIGVGGGIFLTPLLLVFGWATPKQAAAVSAPFIFVNSAAGLLGYSTSAATIPNLWLFLAPAVLLGGFVGARWGSGLARPSYIRWALAGVLAVATAKLMLV